MGCKSSQKEEFLLNCSGVLSPREDVSIPIKIKLEAGGKKIQTNPRISEGSRFYRFLAPAFYSDELGASNTGKVNVFKNVLSISGVA